MENGINNNATYAFHSRNDGRGYMYYTNSNSNTRVESWYTTNIASNTSYSSKVASGDYFCEQAKVAINNSYKSNSGASMTVWSSYTPDFKCSTDGNGKGLVNTSVGLITYDEVVYAGGYYNQENSNYYLHNNTYYWTMSPSGFSGYYANVWRVLATGRMVSSDYLNNTSCYRVVINLNADTAVTGSGTSTDPWVIQ